MSTSTADTTAKPCVTCGYPKYRPTTHATWCWTADPTQPVAGADLFLDSNHNIRKGRLGERARHPDACPRCCCIRRHAWWCDRSLASIPPGRSSDGGGAALGEVSRALAIIDRRSA